MNFVHILTAGQEMQRMPSEGPRGIIRGTTNIEEIFCDSQGLQTCISHCFLWIFCQKFEFLPYSQNWSRKATNAFGAT